jgi:hypothetical protein
MIAIAVHLVSLMYDVALDCVLVGKIRFGIDGADVKQRQRVVAHRSIEGDPDTIICQSLHLLSTLVM